VCSRVRVLKARYKVHLGRNILCIVSVDSFNLLHLFCRRDLQKRALFRKSPGNLRCSSRDAYVRHMYLHSLHRDSFYGEPLLSYILECILDLGQKISHLRVRLHFFSKTYIENAV